MGGKTISQNAPRLGGVRIQTSSYGNAVPLGYGRYRVGGNLIWYGNFRAIPHTTKQGGKGGGATVKSTTYSYEAAIMVCLGHGIVNGVLSAWKGKERLTGETVPGQIRSLKYEVEVSGGAVVTVPEAAAFKANGGVTDLDYYYWDGSGLYEGEHYTRSGGTYTFAEWFPTRRVRISYTVQDSSTWVSALGMLRLSLANGTPGQPVWSWLQSYKPDEALAYSGFAYLYSQNYELTDAAELHNHNFELTTSWEIGTVPGRSAPVYDADPAAIVEHALTDTTAGAGWPSAKLVGLDTYRTYCRATGLWLSPVLVEQLPAGEWLKGMLELTNTNVVWSQGVLKFVPLGDETVTKHGVTYTANTTPVYDLTEDDFVPATGEPPVRVRRHQGMEGSGELADGDDVGYNVITLEIENRDNAYNLEPVDAADAAHIEIYGRRPKSTVKAHAIKEVGVGSAVAHLMLQAELGKRNVYEFAVSWNRGDLLEPLDLVTLTEPSVGLDRTPVRLLTIEEADDHRMLCTAEDAPIGVASAPQYGVQAGKGFEHNYAVDPGDVAEPVFFEPPVELTTTGLEVWAAVTGTSETWGGCRVWASLDGLNYREVATLYGGARYGKLTGTLAAGAGATASVLLSGLGGQLQSGSAQDAAAFATLCWVGGASPEFIAFETATLTGTNAYNLTGLARSGYGTTNASKPGDTPFVRVDASIAKSEPLALDMVGKEIRFKFTSFNVYGGGEQALADVDEYAYTITGAMVQLPPKAVTGLTASVEEFGIRVRITPNAEPDVTAYQYRVGSTFATATVIESAGGSSFLWKVQVAGTYRIWAVAVDAVGNLSTPVSYDVTLPAPNVTTVTAAFSGANFRLGWSAVQLAHAISYYRVRDLTAPGQPVIGTPQDTFFERPVYWGGNRMFGVSPVDVAGNLGTEVTVEMNCAVPGEVTNLRAEVTDNNVLLYWGQSAQGTLPVMDYEVRRGATWASGETIGSNGNSTFGTVFEQVLGVYTYWVVQRDTAGNLGTPASVSAFVNQPPDYVLQDNFESTFTGTCSNTYVDNGKVYGPSLNETWETHFTSRGWTTIQDQINAGYPNYFQPSGTTGYYEEEKDYGVVLPATTITVTPTTQTLSGSITVALQIWYKTAAGDAWTAAPAGATSVVASNVRYVKVRLTLTAAGGEDLLEITSLNIKLATKRKTGEGTFTASAADASPGTWVAFNSTFLDANTPIVQFNTTQDLLPIVSYSDVPNPTGFHVMAVRRSDGARVTVDGSYIVRGV